MSHICPDCGAVCYCGGDNDIELSNDYEIEDLCEHCPDDEPIIDEEIESKAFGNKQ